MLLIQERAWVKLGPLYGEGFFERSFKEILCLTDGHILTWDCTKAIHDKMS